MWLKPTDPGRTFKRPSRKPRAAEPAVNDRPTTRFARKPPKGDYLVGEAAMATISKMKAPTRGGRLLLACLVALGASAIPGWGQKPDAGEYSRAEHQVKSSRGHRVAMRDGVRLSADIYQPDAERRFPALLSHTPYDNLGEGLTKRARWFAERGYAVVLSDVRGRYDSQGTWDPFTGKHKTDGYDLVEWMADQPWCDGNIGMIGGSYGGWTQWWTASEAPLHLKAIAPRVAPPSSGLLNAPYQNGILVSWVIDWMAGMARRTAQTVGSAPYWGHTERREENMSHVPQAGIAEIMGVRNAPWFEEWIRNNTENDYWARNSYDRYEKIGVPSLNLTGWFDANYPGSPQNYKGMRDIHDRYLSRMDAVIRILPSAGALSSAVTLRSPSVFANQVARSTSHVTRHPCARIGSPHRTGRGTVAEDSVWVFRPAGLETEIRTHQKFPRKLPANSFA